MSATERLRSAPRRADERPAAERGPAQSPRLVVIGNGMAGARTVEEILSRGGDFRITMFGDEPYGNYNRIMLSNVLAGVEDESGIFLTTWAGTPTTASPCTQAAGSAGSTGSPSRCTPRTAPPPRTTS